MRNAVLCVGNYAKQPYTFQRIGVKVYCVEELCYCLGENAYLLDHAIVSKELVDWIDKQCGLTQLAGELNGLINHQASESAFVGTILQYVGYQTEEEIHHIETVLSEGASMDAGEKRKARADYFLKNGQVWQAMQEYEALEREIPYENGTAGDRENLAKVHHNRGVLLTQLFLFEEAAEEFMNSYRISGSEESYVEYLLAMRMYCPQEQYLAYISEHEEAYRYSLLAEKRISGVEEKWKESEAMQGLENLRQLKIREGNVAYDREAGKLTGKLKEHYRSLMQG